jgi:hypothetical protein
VVAADASGNFVVVWSSYVRDGNYRGVFGQRYDSAGERLGAEFQVNSSRPSTTRFARTPSVAAAAGGDFVVVWTSDDGSDTGILGQRFDNAGSKLGGEFRVNSYTTGRQAEPALATEADGAFVVVWERHFRGGIFGQRYDAVGQPLGEEFHVSLTSPTPSSPSVAADPTGNFVVVWQGDSGYPNVEDVFGQRFDSSGARVGSEFQANGGSGQGFQYFPSVATDALGNFVVVWQHFGYYGVRYGIHGARFDSSGNRLGYFVADQNRTVKHGDASVSSDALGNFLVVWQSFGSDGDGNGVLGQRYDSAGVAQGNNFLVNSFTDRDQLSPSVAATGPDQFVVAWESFVQDGSGFGVFGQRFDFGAWD